MSNIESDNSQNVGLEDYNNIFDRIFPYLTTPSIKCAVDSTQWAVFLTFLFVKLGSCNFVCSLEFGFHKQFCKLFLKILFTNGVHWVHSGL